MEAAQEADINAGILWPYPKPRKLLSSPSRSERLLAFNSLFQVHPVPLQPVPLVPIARQDPTIKGARASKLSKFSPPLPV